MHVYVIHTIGALAAGGDSAALFANQGQFLLNIAVGIALPMLVALLTHRLASGQVKTLVLLALSILGSLLATITVASFHWQDFLSAFVTQFGTAAIAHIGALKPLGITGTDGVIATNASAGIGAPTTATVPDPADDAVPDPDDQPVAAQTATPPAEVSPGS